jgi:hypothetical protein
VKHTRTRTGSVRALILTGLAALVALCALAPTASAATITIKSGKGGLPRFVAPQTVYTGEELEVVNKTNPKAIGPHTFSLVTQASLPKTAKARQQCFAPGHICQAIARWHGVKGNGPVKKNPAEAGAEGWDTLGSLKVFGDSWFTGNKAGTSFSQPITVDASAGPTKIYFLCAIHSFMQGQTTVLQGG